MPSQAAADPKRNRPRRPPHGQQDGQHLQASARHELLFNLGITEASFPVDCHPFAYKKNVLRFDAPRLSGHPLGHQFRPDLGPTTPAGPAKEDRSQDRSGYQSHHAQTG
jgi:hypothetical protein